MLFNYFLCKFAYWSFEDAEVISCVRLFTEELHCIITASSCNIFSFLNETGVVDLQVFEETDALG